MSKSGKSAFGNKHEVTEGSQAAMERMLLEEYLEKKGYHLKDLSRLLEEQARTLMKEACQYASLRLAQVESSAHLREKIRAPS